VKRTADEESTEREFPFDNLVMSDHADKILQRFWNQIIQRRPFKHDFPDMYEKAREEFDEMFQDIADTIDGADTE
jgi:hypothetical protein